MYRGLRAIALGLAEGPHEVPGVCGEDLRGPVV